jgi:hypothetical protein
MRLPALVVRLNVVLYSRNIQAILDRGQKTRLPGRLAQALRGAKLGRHDGKVRRPGLIPAELR